MSQHERLAELKAQLQLSTCSCGSVGFVCEVCKCAIRYLGRDKTKRALDEDED